MFNTNLAHFSHYIKSELEFHKRNIVTTKFFYLFSNIFCIVKSFLQVKLPLINRMKLKPLKRRRKYVSYFSALVTSVYYSVDWDSFEMIYSVYFFICEYFISVLKQSFWLKISSRKERKKASSKSSEKMAHMFVLAVAVSHSPAKAMISRPLESWLKKRGCPAQKNETLCSRILQNSDMKAKRKSTCQMWNVWIFCEILLIELEIFSNQMFWINIIE